MAFGSSFLTDLAGNAFHAGQCAAMLVALWTALGLALAKGHRGAPAAAAVEHMDRMEEAEQLLDGLLP